MSEDYAACVVAKQHGMRVAMESRCPFLQESQAQYCSAAAVTKFIPYSEAHLSRCGGENHRTCGVYLARHADRRRDF